MIRKALWIVPIIVTLLTGLPLTAAQADEGLAGFSRIGATPFDSRLARTGLFVNHPPSATAGSAPNIETLFQEARSFRYRADSSGDQWQSADETSRLHAGDCEDKAVWLLDQLLKSGHTEACLVIGRRQERDSRLHVWVEVTDSEKNRWILDPVFNRRLWKESDFKGSYYGLRLYAFNSTGKFISNSRINSN